MLLLICSFPSMSTNFTSSINLLELDLKPVKLEVFSHCLIMAIYKR